MADVPSVRQTHWLVVSSVVACLVALNVTAFFIIKREATTTRYIEENRKRIEQSTATAQAGVARICVLAGHFAEYYRLQITSPPKDQTTDQLVAALELVGYLDDLIAASKCTDNVKSSKSSSRFGPPRTTPTTP